jgi:hypothetical protein
MRPIVLCIAATVLAASTAAIAQRAPTRGTPPAPYRPAPRQPAPAPARQPVAPTKPPQRPEKPNAAGDSGPARPAGFKPITLKTAQLETERLRAAILSVEKQIQTHEAGAASGTTADGAAAAAKPEEAEKASATEKTATDDPSATKEKATEKPTLATVERENRALRRQLDKLLVRLVSIDGTLEKRAAGLPPYDPHILDSPQDGSFCPGKTMEQLEHTMRFAGVPVGESGDAVAYEWTFHQTNAKRTAHETHRVWALMKDGMSNQVMEAAPGVRKEGPPPRTK